jgi:cell division protease FtsH
MVCQWGMSDAIGPLALDDKGGQEVFLGRDFSQGKHFSEKVAAEVDKEVHKLVTEGYRKALQILKDNKETLVSMAEALLIKETLGASDLEKIVEGIDIVTAEEKKAYEERIRTKPQNIYEVLGEKIAEKEKGSDNSSDDNSENGEAGTPSPA